VTESCQNPVLRFVRKLVGGAAEVASDAELLQRFVADRDESAFELLMWRHGAMVLNVCRAVLRDSHEAEDAFQATFLTLARKARSVRSPEALAGWLYQIAHRVALRLHKHSARRLGQERTGADLSHLVGSADPAAAAAAKELAPLLYAEVDRLPARYRAPVVLCYLEGKTNDEAARRLGWARGTVSGRLARARELLRRRLGARGAALTTGLCAAALPQSAAALPPALLSATLKAALLSAAGKSVAGTVSPTAAALSEGVLKAMLLTKLKVVAALALLLGLAGAGAGLASRHVLASPADEGGGQVIASQKEGGVKAAPRRLKVPSRVDGVVEVVGTEIKDGEKVPPADVVTITVEEMKRQFRRLREGDRVEPGQLLARLNDTQARNEVKFKQAKIVAANAEYKAALATSKEAAERLRRVLKLKEAKAVSEEEVTAATLTQVRYAQEAVGKEQGVKLAQLELEQAELVLRMYEIRSPVGGVIRRITRQPGEAVRALETVFEIEVAQAKKPGQ
jgi:RNA polymerase sigma factor (sigma-70 family)